MDIYAASALGKLEIVSNILKSNQALSLKLNKKGWSALMYACFYSHRNIVKYLVLIAPGCIYLVNKKNQTALMLSCYSNDADIVKLVLQGDIVENTDINGWNVLFYAVYWGQEAIVRLLITYGINLNSQDNKGKTALMIAASENIINIVGILILFGADCFVLSNENKTATDYAIERKNYDVVDLLTISHFTDLHNLLQHLSLNKYISNFEQNQVDLDQFLKLTEEDLKRIGIKLLGPRRKMAIAISKLNYLNTLKNKSV